MYVHCVCDSVFVTLGIYEGSTVLCLWEGKRPVGWIQGTCVEQLENDMTAWDVSAKLF